MPKITRGTSRSKMSIERKRTHTTPLGQSKEIVPLNDNNKTVAPATEYRIIEVGKMICDGKSKQTCLDYIQNTYEIGIQQAKQYYQAALNWLLPDDLDEYKKGLLQANIERLEKIIEDGIEHKNDSRRGADYLRTAKDAISELNKMLGVGNNRIVVAENAEGDKAISIEFN